MSVAKARYCRKTYGGSRAAWESLNYAWPLVAQLGDPRAMPYRAS